MSANIGATPPRRTWPQRLVLALGVALVLGCVAGAAGAAYGAWKFGQVEKYEIDLPDAVSGAPRNYLVVGSDSREAIDADRPGADLFVNGEAGGRRSDTILVIRVDPRRESATMLSLPRDLWVPIAGTGKRQRINTAYGLGKQVLTDTVQDYLGIPIHHYIEVDFSGFQGLVSAIDGVPMYFERAMRDPYSGLDVLHPGCLTLDPDQALAFARARHLEFIRDGEWQSDPTGDLGRISRQQIFIRRAISRAVDKGTSNPLTLKRLVDVGVSNVGIDDQLSPRDLLALARRFSSFSGDQLVTYTLPVTERVTEGGADVLELQEAAAVPTLDLFRDRPGSVPGGASSAGAAPVEGGVDVRVLNGSGVAKRAANAAGALQAAGFGIAGTGNAEDIGVADVDRSEVRHAAGDEGAADLVARHLTAGADLVEDADATPGTVILVAGRDFTTVEVAALPAVPGEAGDGTTSTTEGTTATTAPTTTTVVGRTPGEPPPGTTCG